MYRGFIVMLCLLLGVSARAAQQPVGSVSQVTLSVPGMTCRACPITVRKALSRVPGVLAVQVDYDNKTAQVRIDPTRVQVPALTEATRQAGYPSSLATQ